MIKEPKDGSMYIDEGVSSIVVNAVVESDPCSEGMFPRGFVCDE